MFIFFCFIIDILKRMVEEALIYDNVNVVVVDWVSGKPNRHPVIIICREKTVVFCASLLLLLCFLFFSFSYHIITTKGSGPPYTQAVANIRLIGVMLAHLVLFLHVRISNQLQCQNVKFLIYSNIFCFQLFFRVNFKFQRRIVTLPVTV